MEQFLTEGARRSLQRAVQLACRAGADHVEPLHLLWALLLEESRASEIMAEGGLNHQRLEKLCPLDLSQEQTPPSPTDMGTDTEIQTPPSSTLLDNVISEARRQAGLAGRHAEVGSEHLLWGLGTVESPVSQVLEQHGLNAEALSSGVIEKSGFSTEPLDVDFSIAWHEQTASDHTDTLRIVDAAANRAREGLRVVEDFVRFTLNDAHLTALLKNCRHQLTQTLRAVTDAELLSARDTRQDVGTNLSTQTETRRSSPVDVVQANFKRVQEATRTLEEFGKIIAGSLGEKLGQVRYELYTLEKAVLATHQNRQRFDGRHLYLLVTESLCHHGSGPVIRESLTAGVGIVQVREKSVPDRGLIEHGHRVHRWTREAGALFIMNDRPDLAVLTDADGVHVGRDELSVREARRIVGPDRLVGVSTHTIDQARQAVLDGADYLGVGPVFPSTTKSFEELAGLEFVRQVAAEITLPWFAIGGINPGNIDQVIDAGATRIAVSSTICGAPKPAQAAQELLQRIHRLDAGS